MDSLGSAEDMVDSPGAAVAKASIGNVMKCVAGSGLGLGVGTLSLILCHPSIRTLSAALCKTSLTL